MIQIKVNKGLESVTDMINLQMKMMTKRLRPSHTMKTNQRMMSPKKTMIKSQKRLRSRNKAEKM